DARKATAPRHVQRRRVVLLGLPEERERIGQIFDREPGLLGEPVRRQVIGVAPRRRLRDLDQPLGDAALEVGVDETERDSDLGGEPALRLSLAALDRLEQLQHDPGLLGVGRFWYARRHAPPPLWRRTLARSCYEPRLVLFVP